MSATDTLQRTLAAEHAAIFVFGALGGRASTLDAPALRGALDAAYDAHVERRDRLRRLVVAAGSEPVAAEPAYRLPSPLVSVVQIAAAALRVERACAATYAKMVAGTSGDDRRWAVEALIAAALGERSFGGAPEPLPGLPRR
jgi:hypothetical protein